MSEHQATLMYERVGPGVYQASFCPLVAGRWTVSLEFPPFEEADVD